MSAHVQNRLYVRKSEKDACGCLRACMRVFDPTPPPAAAHTLSPQPPLLQAKYPDFGEDVDQVAVAQPLLLAGALTPPVSGWSMGVLLSRLSLLPDQPARDSRCHVSTETAKPVPSRSVSPAPSAVSTGGDGAQTKPDTDLQSSRYNGSILLVITR